MSQAEVLKLLRKKKRWMSIKEIAKIVGITPSNVRRNLKKLKWQGLVEEKLIFRKVFPFRRHSVWRAKR